MRSLEAKRVLAPEVCVRAALRSSGCRRRANAWNRASRFGLRNGGVQKMIRSARWPLLVVCLAGGVAVGRWAGQTEVQGQLAPAVAAIPRELTSYRDVVKRVLPAVVSIEAKAKPRPQISNTQRRGQRPGPQGNPGLPD